MSNGWGEGHLNNNIGWGNSEYSITEVNISSAQILAMGTTPIELLPAAGVNKYYDIDKVIMEFTYTSGIYDINMQPVFKCGTNLNYGLTDQTLTWTNDTQVFVVNDIAIGTASGYPSNQPLSLNSALELTTNTGVNPTGGVGSFRVKIYHKTITFGA